MPPAGIAFEASYNLLHEPLIGWRDVALGDQHQGSLPEVLAALAADQVRDFPRLRVHQRHPWHAFLVQLAAIALHRAGQSEPWHSADDWCAALRALTPDHPDDAPWCLVAPSDRPALLQAPVDGVMDDWEISVHTPDRLDMIGTSKNHDLKRARMRIAKPEDWLFALVSLQTQAGSNSGSYKGISRMNSGAGSRPGVEKKKKGNFGKRWFTDLNFLQESRKLITKDFGFLEANGIDLVWMKPWNGVSSIPFEVLDPYYIEICRRIRITFDGLRFSAYTAKTPISRIEENALRKGVTGDPWTPINKEESKIMAIPRSGFGYELISKFLFFDGLYKYGATQSVANWPDGVILELICQGIAPDGNSKTSGYHERRVPISPKLRLRMMGAQRPLLAKLAKNRIQAIADMRKLLWNSLALLFANGENKRGDDAVNDRASRFAQPFEQQEDARFFDDLTLQAEAEDGQQDAIYLQWLLGLADRAEAVLRQAFDAGPRSGMQRYKAQSAALSRFHAGLRGGKKPPFPELVVHYAALRTKRASVSEGETHV